MPWLHSWAVALWRKYGDDQIEELARVLCEDIEPEYRAAAVAYVMLEMAKEGDLLNPLTLQFIDLVGERVPTPPLSNSLAKAYGAAMKQEGAKC